MRFRISSPVRKGVAQNSTMALLAEKYPALQRHFEELTTDCTDCTDNTMVDRGPSVKSVKSVVETSKEVSL